MIEKLGPAEWFGSPANHHGRPATAGRTDEVSVTADLERAVERRPLQGVILLFVSLFHREKQLQAAVFSVAGVDPPPKSADCGHAKTNDQDDFVW